MLSHKGFCNFLQIHFVSVKGLDVTSVTTSDLCMCGGCVFVCACDVSLQALEKAKEAGKKERALVRQREQSGNADNINLDLTYSVSKTAEY